MLGNFLSDIRGNLAVPATMGMLCAATLSGGLYDFVSVSSQRAELQSLADAAALSAVREMAIVRDNARRIEFVASAYVASARSDLQIKTNAVADMDNNKLSVELTSPVNAHFPGPFSRIGHVSVTAQAELLGQPGNVCLIGLAESVKRAVSMNNKSLLSAENCGIYSNSTLSDSVYIHNHADITVDLIYTAGGVKGEAAGTSGDPVTDASPIPDPLAGRAPPLAASRPCDFVDKVVTGVEQLSGGVYCGGLKVEGSGARAELFAGEYIIRDGPLKVKKGGTLTGDYVGFYLDGEDSKLEFEEESTIDLVAPKTGDMTGLLFWANPANGMQLNKGEDKFKGGHVISSDDARRMVGTIYLPDDLLIVDGNTPVADRSEYTVIVAQGFELNNGPNLVLKTDYALSDVPVPEGVGPMRNADTRLVE